MKTNPDQNFTLITGSDFTHAKSLLNFLSSVKAYAPHINVIVYDLGMTSSQLRRLRKKFNYEVRRFDYSKHPDYFNIKIDAGQFAWKPVIIEEVASERGGIVSWMDAGNLITAPLENYINEIREIGFSRVSSGGPIGEWTHPLMLKYFNLPANWKARAEMLAGGCVGFDTKNPKALTLLQDWAKFASIKNCIAPEGSNRSNHRQDQALLTVLAGIQNWPLEVAANHCPVIFHQDIPDENVSLKRRYRRLAKRLRKWLVSKLGKTL